MYFGAQAVLGYSFAQEAGNKIRRFVNWHLPSTTSSAAIGEHLLDGAYTVDYPRAPAPPEVPAVDIREDWFPLDRCTDAAVATGGLNPPFGTACGGVFHNVRRVLCALGKGRGGV